MTTTTYRRTALVKRHQGEWNPRDGWHGGFTREYEVTEQTSSQTERLDGEISLVRLVKVTTVVIAREEVLVGDQPIFIRTAIVEREIGGARDSQDGFYGLPHRFTTTETTGSPDEKLQGEVELVSIQEAKRKDPQ